MSGMRLTLVHHRSGKSGMDFSLQLQRSKVLGLSTGIGGIAVSQTALGSIQKRIGQKYAAIKMKPAGTSSTTKDAGRFLKFMPIIARLFLP